MPYRTLVLPAVFILFSCLDQAQEPTKSSEPYWDSVYSQNRAIFSQQPTELLKYAIKDRASRKMVFRPWPMPMLNAFPAPRSFIAYCHTSIECCADSEQI